MMRSITRTTTILSAALLSVIASAASAQTRIAVTPRELRTPVPPAASAPVSCDASYGADAIAPASKLPDCDVDILSPSMPTTNYQLTLSLAFRYTDFNHDAPLQFYIRQQSFPKDHFNSFDIQLPAPASLTGIDISSAISNRMRLLCANAGADPGFAWQSALWANVSLAHIGPGQPIAEAQRSRLQRVLYASCLRLIQNNLSGATVAGSISHGGLRVCDADLAVAFEQAESGPMCPVGGTRDKLKILADQRVKATLLAEQQRINGLFSTNIGQPQKTALLLHLSSAVVAERGASNLSPAAFTDLDTGVTSLFQEAISGEAALEAAQPQGSSIDPRLLERAGSLMENLSAFKGKSGLGSLAFEPADKAFSDFYRDAAERQETAWRYRRTDIVRDQSRIISDDFKKFEEGSVVKNSDAFKNARSRVRSMEAATTF